MENDAATGPKRRRPAKDTDAAEVAPRPAQRGAVAGDATANLETAAAVQAMAKTLLLGSFPSLANRRPYRGQAEKPAAWLPGPATCALAQRQRSMRCRGTETGRGEWRLRKRNGRPCPTAVAERALSWCGRRFGLGLLLLVGPKLDYRL